MPENNTDPLNLHYTQYRDEGDNPKQCPMEYFSLEISAYFYEYTLTMLNLVGTLPWVQGFPPFYKDPYGYHWEDLDEWGQLRKFEWTYCTQLLPLNYPFPLHQAFIPFDMKQFNFDPCLHLLEARGPNSSL
jgi:hypothetical protein